MKLLSGGVGRHGLANPTRRELERLFKALRPLEDQFDLILIDHGAGIGYATLAHLAASTSLLLVTSHEITGLSDAYAVYKRGKMVNPDLQVGMVFNRVPDRESADAAWQRFRDACKRFLGSEPEHVGVVPADAAVSASVDARIPVSLHAPTSRSAHAFSTIARWNRIDTSSSVTAFFDRAARALR
jgi:MinD-like ATPase involved in chromosome partitioning or flagellar assembly